MFLFCNKCFQEQKVLTDLEFFMSTCGHIFCNECVTNTCRICERPFNRVAINQDMKKDFSLYFDDPSKQFKRLQQIIQFQCRQNSILFKHSLHQLPKQMEQTQLEVEGILKMEEKIKKCQAEEKNKIEKLKEYINYHERRREQLPVNTSYTQNKKMKRVHHDSRSTASVGNLFTPKTPTISLDDKASSSGISSGQPKFNINMN